MIFLLELHPMKETANTPRITMTDSTTHVRAHGAKSSCFTTLLTFVFVFVTQFSPPTPAEAAFDTRPTDPSLAS